MEATVTSKTLHQHSENQVRSELIIRANQVKEINLHK